MCQETTWVCWVKRSQIYGENTVVKMICKRLLGKTNWWGKEKKPKVTGFGKEKKKK
jgi:hypothetical protein